MRSRLSTTTLVAGMALVAAAVLTIVRPSPEGLFRVSVGDREVRAAPGEATPRSLNHDLVALNVFNTTLVRIRDSYVDPSRIDPKEMLYAALDSVQFDIPEVLVEADRSRDEVVVVVNDKRQTFSTSSVDSPWRLAGKLKRIFRFIEANMNPGADLAQVEYAAVNGMLRTLDPHSVLLDPETAREMDVNTTGKFGGLGIVIRMHKRKLTVVRPMKGTPAAAAGLQSGDFIYKINDEVTENLTLNDAVSRMRGDAGTDIVIWVKREGVPNVLRFDIKRAIIRVESVESEMLSNNVGYIKLKQFSGRSAHEIKQAMKDLEAKGARGFVFDMRWNPGGLLEQAIQISDLFVDAGTIVTTVGGRERDPRRARRKGSNTTAPVAVLVNGNSASASEIVAGALKNLDRAIVIGTSTFGKGSVQILYDNKDNSKLKLTIAQYLTPGDQSIQSVGIAPDIALHRMFVSKQNAKPGDGVRLLESENSYREADLASHLTSRYAKAGDKPAYNLPFLYEPPARPDVLEDEDGGLPDEDDEPLEDEFVEDFEIRLARDVVAASPKATRKAMIKAAKRIVDRQRAEEATKLQAALGKLGVDWSAPAAKAAPTTLTAQVVLDPPGGTVNAGDTVKLTGTVTNTGATAAHQVMLRADSEDRYFDETELVFGKIEPGQSRTWTSFVKVPDDADERVDLLSFALKEAAGATASVKPVKFRIKAAERPVFAYSYQLIDDGNGDGLVQKQESHRLRVQVRNIGKGEAAETTAILRNASGDGAVVKKGRFELGSLKPGDSKTIEFMFDVTSELSEKELVVEMTVYDGRLHDSVSEKLKYPVQRASAGPAKASGAVAARRDGVAIREGAAQHAAIVGFADRGASFKVSAKQSGWVRVDLGGGRPGFVATADVSTARAAARPKVRTHWQVTPPVLALSVPSLEASGDSYTLSGTARDDTRIEDVYIFVSNRDAKIDNKKVFYKSNRGAKQPGAMAFSSQIPLWPGSNRVTVIVRENDAVKSSETLYLYRSGK